MEDELEYSNEALEVKGLFYNKTITVYVEGKDDILFWNNLFDLAEIEAYIEEVGGKEELEKYIKKITDDGAEFAIAMDNDNSEFLNNQHGHSNIIRTYGYSIENSMYFNHRPIEKVITNFCRKKIDFSDDFKDWIESFTSTVIELIVLDIANNRFGKGVSVFGDNCFRFLKTQNSFEVCNDKINVFIEGIKRNFSNDEIEEVRRLINQNEKDLWFLIKGHFITHSLLNLIKKAIRINSGLKKNVSEDYLYSITVDCREDWQNRIDISTVVEKIKLIEGI